VHSPGAGRGVAGALRTDARRIRDLAGLHASRRVEAREEIEAARQAVAVLVGRARAVLGGRQGLPRTVAWPDAAGAGLHAISATTDAARPRRAVVTRPRHS